METPTSETKPEHRLARILLPASILRDVDQIVLDGTGGYRTRQEFFSDAIQNHVLEIRHGVTGDGQIQMGEEPPAASSTNGHSSSRPSLAEAAAPPPEPDALADAAALVPVATLAETAIRPAARGAVVRSDGVGSVTQEPLFGMHNRDYPSLWALSQIAGVTAEGPQPPQGVLDQVTREAWRYGHRLRALEEHSKVKLTALFPTNVVKPQSAEEGFRAFAVGEIARRRREDGTVKVGGPLFNWGACQLVREDGRLLLGMTERGYELLELVSGLTLAWPHEREQANTFLGFLRSSAPLDWEGFVQILLAVAERPNREELVVAFQQWRPDWRDAHANTNAAGYIARAREWGLVEPKLIERRYVLTEFGGHMHDQERS